MHQCTSSPIASVTGNMDMLAKRSAERGDGDVRVRQGGLLVRACWCFADRCDEEINLQRGNVISITSRTARRRKIPSCRLSYSQSACDGAIEAKKRAEPPKPALIRPWLEARGPIGSATLHSLAPSEASHSGSRGSTSELVAMSSRITHHPPPPSTTPGWPLWSQPLQVM
jgi:hypothetical protein